MGIINTDEAVRKNVELSPSTQINIPESRKNTRKIRIYFQKKHNTFTSTTVVLSMTYAVNKSKTLSINK